MRRLSVTPPGERPSVPRELGRLGPALAWLSAAQGVWPPHAPAQVRRVLVTDGSREDGMRQADELADGGCDLVVLSTDADPVPGLVALSALLDLEPVAAVGTSAGADWAALTTGVRDGLRGARMHVGDPDGLLTTIGSGALAQATGLLAQCAVRRTPVLLDGSATGAAAAVVAERLAPGAPQWWLPGQVPPAPAARQGLADLGLTGLLDLGLGGPAGAEMALGVLLQAIELV